MNKKRGYYTIDVAGVEITGHFSVNFWALLEDELGFDTLGETFAFMGRGIGMSKIRQIVYCSSKAYCLEEEIPPLFNNIFKCGTAIEDFTEEHMIQVMEAFAESKLLGNDANLGIERNPAKGESTEGDEGK